MSKWKLVPTSEKVGSLLLVVLGVAVVGLGSTYGVLDKSGIIGAGFLPVFTGLALVISAAYTLVKDLRLAGSNDSVDAESELNEIAEDDEAADLFGRNSFQRKWAVWIIFGIILGAILLIQVLGLLLSLTVMVFALVLVVERKGILPAIISAVLAFAFAYVVFDLLLGVRMPSSLIEII